jgi:hypothetical protein
LSGRDALVAIVCIVGTAAVVVVALLLATFA